MPEYRSTYIPRERQDFESAALAAAQLVCNQGASMDFDSNRRGMLDGVGGYSKILRFATAQSPQCHSHKRGVAPWWRHGGPWWTKEGIRVDHLICHHDPLPGNRMYQRAGFLRHKLNNLIAAIFTHSHYLPSVGFFLSQRCPVRSGYRSSSPVICVPDFGTYSGNSVHSPGLLGSLRKFLGWFFTLF
ncbi:hypothetical protein DFH09DRAFT_1082513 [Mycena vulgaris]|nr:hypothetical protein DFH09DRAFT_1082513 [Mycena vulgaris]